MSHPAFHLSLTVLVHYRSLILFSLGGWFPPIPTRYVPRSTWEIPRVIFNFAYEIFTLYDWPFQAILLLNTNPNIGLPQPSRALRIVRSTQYKVQSENKIFLVPIYVLSTLYYVLRATHKSLDCSVFARRY